MLVHTFTTVQNHFTLVIQFIQVIHLNEQVQILSYLLAERMIAANTQTHTGDTYVC